jgi:multiple sugar transport system ATP-binding protein
MNLVNGAIAAEHGAATVGIRPEHIAVGTETGPWPGVVGVSEHLGSDTFFHVTCEGIPDPVTVRVSGEIDLNYGDKVFLTPDAANLHRFDDKGLRIA